MNESRHKSTTHSTWALISAMTAIDVQTQQMHKLRPRDWVTCSRPTANYEPG